MFFGPHKDGPYNAERYRKLHSSHTKNRLARQAGFILGKMRNTFYILFYTEHGE